MTASPAAMELPAPVSLPILPLDLAVKPYVGMHSGFGERARLVVRDLEDWRVVWRQVLVGSGGRPGLPQVDFSREMVVVAAMGPRPSGGYGIAIERAFSLGPRLYVVVRETVPEPGTAATAAVTSPVDVARLPRSDEEVLFIEQTGSRTE